VDRGKKRHEPWVVAAANVVLDEAIEIADRLGITYPTVDSHVQHIYEKLQVHNAPAAINKAHRVGIFPPKP
jgi:FixJ family two-component response regulator